MIQFCAAELHSKIATAIEALRAVDEYATDTKAPGYGDFSRRIQKQIIVLSNDLTKLDSGKPLSGRGRVTARKKRMVGGSRGDRGGRPRREALIALLKARPGDDKATLRALKIVPGKLLRYACRKTASDEDALRWLLVSQPEFNKETPLYMHQCNLRKFLKRVVMPKEKGRDPISAQADLPDHKPP